MAVMGSVGLERRGLLSWTGQHVAMSVYRAPSILNRVCSLYIDFAA